MTRRVRFEVRVLGVATLETFHFEEVIPSAEMPRLGEFAGPRRSLMPWRRVTAVEPGPEVWSVKLEDIDCSRLERDDVVESAALRNGGWTPRPT